MDRLRMEGGGVLLTSAEVAERIGKDASWVRRLCKGGWLPGATNIANRWLIPEGAIEEYRKHPDKRKKKAEG